MPPDVTRVDQAAGDLALTGFRVGVTAARKAEEQIQLLERRGAQVEWAPALSLDPNHVDDDLLRVATEDVLARPASECAGGWTRASGGAFSTKPSRR